MNLFRPNICLMLFRQLARSLMGIQYRIQLRAPHASNHTTRLKDKCRKWCTLLELSSNLPFLHSWGEMHTSMQRMEWMKYMTQRPAMISHLFRNIILIPMPAILQLSSFLNSKINPPCHNICRWLLQQTGNNLQRNKQNYASKYDNREQPATNLLMVPQQTTCNRIGKNFGSKSGHRIQPAVKFCYDDQKCRWTAPLPSILRLIVKRSAFK